MRYFSFHVKIYVRLETQTPTLEILKKLICFHNVFILQVSEKPIADSNKPFELLNLKFDFFLLIFFRSMLKQYL